MNPCRLLRRCPFSLASTLCLALLPSVSPAQPSSSPQSSAAVAVVNPSVAGQRFAGYASCLARGCHGGPDVTRTPVAAEAAGLKLAAPSLANAGTIWINHDRHTRAYAILKTPRSQEILRRLANAGVLVSPVDLQNPRPEREERCLACHATPSLAANPSDLLEDSLAEGVSCDACHTAPGKNSWDWVDSHPRGALPELRKSRDGSLRMLNTAAKRAELCVGCHVGAPRDQPTGMPLRDMDHTFIAAGHPRLFFDYATYLRLMPPHWKDKSPAADENDEIKQALALKAELDAPAIGAKATLAAELVLLVDRANDPAHRSSLSSMDCFACHHDLTSPSWRQATSKRARLGQAQWLGEQLVEASAPQLLESGSEGATALTAIGGAVRKFQPLPDQHVGTLLNWLAADQDVKQSISIDAALLLPAWPEESPQKYAGLSWDQAARRYYLAREVARIGPPDGKQGPELPTAFAALRESLVFQGDGSGLLSPKDYNPQLSGEHYTKLRSLLIGRWKPWKRN